MLYWRKVVQHVLTWSANAALLCVCAAEVRNDLSFIIRKYQENMKSCFLSHNLLEKVIVLAL